MRSTFAVPRLVYGVWGLGAGPWIAAPGVKNIPPGWLTLPSAVFSALTASAVNIAFVCASGGPPTIATAGLSSASSFAIRSTRFAGTPVICSTRWGVYSSSPP